MSEQTATSDQTTSPPPGPPPRSYPPLNTLRRSRTDRKLLGVAGGLGRYAGIDPLVFRILFVVLAIFGGSVRGGGPGGGAVVWSLVAVCSLMTSSWPQDRVITSGVVPGTSLSRP